MLLLYVRKFIHKIVTNYYNLIYAYFDFYSFRRYKSLYTEGRIEKALDICRDYLNRLDELRVEYPHRNYEVATIAICSCLWGMAQNC